jgi:hypothetical protein
LRIVCPFIKEAPVRRLLGDSPPPTVEVITRFSLADFGAGVSDIGALRALIDAGARVRGVRHLHSKLFVFGDSQAIVTSANLTMAALSRNFEFGCVADESYIVAQCRAYFDRLWANAGHDLASSALDTWSAQVADFLATGGRPAAAQTLPDHGATPPEAPSPGWPASATGEGWPAQSGQAFVKMFGEGHNRAPWSLDTLEEVEVSGCHWACTYPSGRRPRIVDDGDTVFMGRMVRSPADTAVYGRAIALAYVDGRDDASSAELAARPWKAQWPHYVRVHHAEFVAGRLSNGVSLRALIDALGTDAFASTQARAARGESGINPRMSVRQQPAVRLSSEGAAWLSAQLDKAFFLHGRVPTDDLAELDWPEDVVGPVPGTAV